jgi:hypothetical protein
LQITLKRGQNVLDLGCAFDVTGQMKDDLWLRLAADFANLRKIRKLGLPPPYTFDVGWSFRPVDAVYFRALLTQTAAQMRANESIGAGDENPLSPEGAFHRVLSLIELVSQFWRR